MKVTYEKGLFVGLGAFADNATFKAAGFRFHPGIGLCGTPRDTCPCCRAGLEKIWYTPRRDRAARLAAVCDPKAQAQLVEHVSAIEASRALDANLEIPVPEGLKLFGYQKAGVRYIAGRSGTLLGDDMGVGKGQPYSSQVLTPTGFSPMGELAISDLVVTPDGKHAPITGIYELGTVETYRVSFTDGSSTVCTHDHLWNVLTPCQKKRKSNWKTVPLHDLIGKLKHKSGNIKYYIPMIEKGIDLGPPVASTELHPYLFGYLLGNGCFRGNSIRVSIPDDETATRLAGLLPDDVELHWISNYDYSVSRKQHGPNSVLDKIRDMGLHGHGSPDKWVPNHYLWTTYEHRLALFHGLMDSDGSYAGAKTSAEFSSSSSQLADAVVFLAQSFGGRVSRCLKKTTHLDSHRLIIGLPNDVPAFLLSRKNERMAPRTKYQVTRGIASIEPVGREQCRCIMVDHPDHLYVTDSFIVTHNTVQAVATVNYLREIERVLVICPSSLRVNWFREARRWLVPDHRVWSFYLAESTKAVPSRANFVIVNYEKLLRRRRECASCQGEKGALITCPECKGTGMDPTDEARRNVCRMCRGRKHTHCEVCRGRGKVALPNELLDSLGEREFDLLIVDEAHYLKNPDSGRCRAILGDLRRGLPGLSARASRRVYATGTPILNRPIEVWPILADCAPAIFGDYWQFARRYCDAHEEYIPGKSGRKVVKVDGASHLEELQELARSHCLIRRLKADVLTELPPKIRQIIPLPVSSKDRRLVDEELRDWLAQWGPELDLLSEKVHIAMDTGDGATFDEAAKQLAYLQRVSFLEMSKTRHMVAKAKLPYVLDYLRDALEGGLSKVVVFAHHHDVIEGIAKAFPGEAVVLYGAISDLTERQKAIDSFQTDPKIKLFVGSIQAAGVGITLTAAHTVVFAEESWIPADLTQAEDRLHRIGATKSVSVQHLVWDGSLDARMCHLVVAKQDVADRALDRPTALAPAALPLRPHDPEAKLPPVSSAVKAIVREALRFLATTTEGGFSSFDRVIGQKLATWERGYSDAQAQLALKLAHKYRRQLPPAMVEALGLEAPEKKRGWLLRPEIGGPTALDSLLK